jgi:hypothetical protein
MTAILLKHGENGALAEENCPMVLDMWRDLIGCAADHLAKMIG